MRQGRVKDGGSFGGVIREQLHRCAELTGRLEKCRLGHESNLGEVVLHYCGHA